jgi:hypothetical protein
MPPATSLTAMESLLCAALRGTSGVWRQLGDPVDQASFLEAAAHHRVRPLLAWRVRNTTEWQEWPHALRSALHASERAEAAIEIARRGDLTMLLGALGAAGIPVLLLKGAAFGYTLYPEPWLRPRHDTDLLVAPTDVAEAGQILERAGYQPARAVRGRHVAHQRNFVRHDRGGLHSHCDLHWKPANPVAVADLLSFQELLDASQAVSIAGVRVARTPQDAHALLLACLHRAAHHHDSDDLLWLYDIHLLAERLTEKDVASLIDLSQRSGAGAVCARGLRLALDRFETRLPSTLVPALEAAPAAGPALPAAFLKSGVRKADLLMADLAVLPWRGRLRLLREHLFPPADWMLSDPRPARRLLLPALYLWRIVRGARGWFRPL